MVFVEHEKYYIEWWILFDWKDDLGKLRTLFLSLLSSRVMNTILKFIKLMCNGYLNFNNWSLIVQYLEGYRVVYYLKVVKWVPPPIN